MNSACAFFIPLIGNLGTGYTLAKNICNYQGNYENFGDGRCRVYWFPSDRPTDK
jgi:hypothetical protein